MSERKIKIVAEVIILFMFVASFINIAFGEIQKNKLRASLSEAVSESIYKLRKDEIFNLLNIIKIQVEEKITNGASKEDIIGFVQSLKYGEDGYFYSYSSRGIRLSSSEIDEGIGKSYWNLMDINGQYVIRDLIDIAKHEEMKIYKYYFSREVRKNKLKIGSAFYIKKYDLIIGTGIYIDDIDLVSMTFSDEISKQMERGYNSSVFSDLFFNCLFILIIIVLYKRNKSYKRLRKQDS